MTRYLSPLEVKAAKYFKLNPGDLRETVMPTWSTEETERLLAELVEDFDLCKRTQRGANVPHYDSRFIVPVRHERLYYRWKWSAKIGAEQRKRLGLKPQPQDSFILSGADRLERIVEMVEVGNELACRLGFTVPGEKAGRKEICRRAVKVVNGIARQAFYSAWSDDDFKSRLTKQLASYCKSFIR